MNLVLDNAVEVHTKKGTRKPIGKETHHLRTCSPLLLFELFVQCDELTFYFASVNITRSHLAQGRQHHVDPVRVDTGFVRDRETTTSKQQFNSRCKTSVGPRSEGINCITNITLHTAASCTPPRRDQIHVNYSIHKLD